MNYFLVNLAEEQDRRGRVFQVGVVAAAYDDASA